MSPIIATYYVPDIYHGKIFQLGIDNMLYKDRDYEGCITARGVLYCSSEKESLEDAISILLSLERPQTGIDKCSKKTRLFRMRVAGHW